MKELLLEYHTEQHIMENMLFAIEFEFDNHQELCERLGVSKYPKSRDHIVCADALNYSYAFDGTGERQPEAEAGTLDSFFC